MTKSKFQSPHRSDISNMNLCSETSQNCLGLGEKNRFQNPHRSDAYLPWKCKTEKKSSLPGRKMCLRKSYSCFLDRWEVGLRLKIRKRHRPKHVPFVMPSNYVYMILILLSMWSAELLLSLMHNVLSAASIFWGSSYLKTQIFFCLTN